MNQYSSLHAYFPQMPNDNFHSESSGQYSQAIIWYHKDSNLRSSGLQHQYVQHKLFSDIIKGPDISASQWVFRDFITVHVSHKHIKFNGNQRILVSSLMLHCHVFASKFMYIYAIAKPTWHRTSHLLPLVCKTAYPLLQAKQHQQQQMTKMPSMWYTPLFYSCDVVSRTPF